MNFSKLSLSELLGVIAAAALVIALLFMTWYTLGENPTRRMGGGNICGNSLQCTGFDTFPILRWLLLAAASAPFILLYIVFRGHKLSWAPGELTMVVGFTAFVLIAYNGLIDPPGNGPAEIGITKEAGYYVALASAAGIAASGIGRVMEEQRSGAGQTRKAPGTV